MCKSDAVNIPRNFNSVHPPSSTSECLRVSGNVTPLYWPGGSKPEYINTQSDRIVKFFPVLNYMSRQLNWNKMIKPIFDGIDAQLNSRPAMWDCWHVTGAHLDFVKKLSEIIASEMRWPNDHFIPSDPLEIVLTARRSDGLEIFNSVFRLERQVNLRLGDLRLGDLIKTALTRCKNYEDFVEFFWMNIEAQKTGAQKTGQP